MDKPLVRDAVKARANLQKLSNFTVVTSKPCKITIPVRYESAGLAEIGVDTVVLGIFSMEFEDESSRYYAVFSVDAMVKLGPSKVDKIKVGGSDYYQFSYEAGSVVIQNYNLFVQDVLVYEIYNEFISAGKVPYYMNYEDLGSIFNTAPDYAGANVGQNEEVTETLVAIISRTPGDRSKQFRTLANNPEQLSVQSPAYIPLRSVIYSATNTLSKLAGSYMQVGIVSALVSPSEKVEKLEEILRK
jgi:hypothetical protein